MKFKEKFIKNKKKKNIFLLFYKIFLKKID